MAPNGSRKTPAKPAKSEDMGLLSSSVFDGAFDDNDEKPLKLRDDVKKNLPVVKEPGKWNSEVTGGRPKKSPAGSPLMKKLPSDLAKAFANNKPMEDKPDMQKCNHCKRPVLKHAMERHVQECIQKKQEKQRKKKEAKDARDAAARKAEGKSNGDDDSDDDPISSKTASKTGLGASKKRKAVDAADVDAPKKKKKKDEPKAKAPRPKAPVDVEKQCGVELPQGGQCARSLTCKSHSMGAKRAVPGRSAPYDKLLMEYQRKNQAKLQKAAFDANAPQPDDENLQSGPVDSEEEKDLVMAGIARSFGTARPIYQPAVVPLRRRYEATRLQGMLQSALGGRNGTGLFGNPNAGSGFFGAPPPTDAGADAMRRGSVIPGARSMMAPASRKASMASAI